MRHDHPVLTPGTIVRWIHNDVRGIGHVATDVTSSMFGRTIRINNIDAQNSTDSILNLYPAEVEPLPNSDVFSREGLYTLVDNNGAIKNVYVSSLDGKTSYIEQPDGASVPTRDAIDLLTNYTWHYINTTNDSKPKEYRVEWAIDVAGSSPKDAALRVWHNYFNDREITADTACVFDVTDENGNHTTVDLAEDLTDAV